VKLADEGLVLRDRDPASRRRLQLVLTDRGRTALEQLRGGVVRELEGRLSKLTAEDRALLERARPALGAVFAD
jgi:DNA-binding MarR family transcriptional regulator